MAETKMSESSLPKRPLTLGVWIAVTALCCAGHQAVAQPPDAPPVPEPTVQETPEEAAAPAPDDPRLTAGGALRQFMSSRDYRTIKQLKGVLTESLQARFDHDSAPFNGKRGNRLAAFDFTEKDLRPKGKAPASTYVASVRSLWEEQGEATEKRTETVTIVQQGDALWRIGGLTVASSEKIRFAEAVNGVTNLRMVLRAWHRGDSAAARGNMSESFLKKHPIDGGAGVAPFAPAVGHRHAAYRIVEMTAQGTTSAVAQVRLYDTVPGDPGSLEGEAHTLKMIKKGSRWLLDGWD